MVFNDVDGIYSYTYEAEKKLDCLACSQVPLVLEIDDIEKTKLEDLINILKEDSSYQMKNPGLTTIIKGKNKTLYISAIASIEEKTRVNLKKSLMELGLQDGIEIMVADVTNPNTLIFRLKCKSMDL